MSGMEQYNYAERGAWQQDLRYGESACPHVVRAKLQAGRGPSKLTIKASHPARAGRIRCAGLRACCESDSGLFPWHKLTLSEELWTSAALPVDGLVVPLRGFRKSHQLIPAAAKPSEISACSER